MDLHRVLQLNPAYLCINLMFPLGFFDYFCYPTLTRFFYERTFIDRSRIFDW